MLHELYNLVVLLNQPRHVTHGAGNDGDLNGLRGLLEHGVGRLGNRRSHHHGLKHALRQHIGRVLVGSRRGVHGKDRGSSHRLRHTLGELTFGE